MVVYTSIFFEFLLVASSILFLFKLRNKIGLAPLYIFLGAVQYVQAVYGSGNDVVVFREIIIHPRSVIVFCSIFFAVLLIYIKEGVVSARTLIIGIVISNFLLLGLFGIANLQQSASVLSNTSFIEPAFNIKYKFVIPGTIILLFDFFILIIFYQFLVSKLKKLHFFLVLFISLSTILFFDSIVFNLILNYHKITFKTILLSHILSKTFLALIFSITLYIYLKYIDKAEEQTSFIANQSKGIFSIIKYQKKYINLKQEKFQTEKKLTSQIELTLNNISDGFISLDSNWCYTYVNIKAGEILGKSPESLLGKHICAEFPEGVGLPFYKAYNKAFNTQQTQIMQEYYEPFDKWFENRIYPTTEGVTIYFTDITEKKKAELALAESENHLRTILETEPECIKQLNSKGELIYMNPAGLAMIEANSLESVKGQSVINIINPEYRVAFNKLTHNVFKGESGNLIFEIKGIKGTKRWLETHAVPLKNADDEIISLLGVTRDITEHKQAADKINKSEKYLENIINNIGDPVFVKDEESRLLLVNNAFCTIFNLSKEAVLGKTLAENVSPEERDSFLKIDKQVIKTGIENVNEETLTLNEKETQIISTKKTRYIDDNGNTFLIGVIRDITARKKAEIALKENEEKFSKAFESNVIGKAILNKEKQIIAVNEALSNIVGFKKENMLGKTAEEIGLFNFDNQKNLENEELLWGEFSKTGYVSNIELKYLMNTGKNLFILISLQLLQLNNEDHVMITIIDITEKKNAEAEVEQYKTNLEELIKIRTEEVHAKNDELQRMNKLFVGRELKMKELKNIIKELQQKKQG